MSAESMRLVPRRVSLPASDAAAPAVSAGITPSEAALCFYTESSGAAFADDGTALGATPPPVAPGAVAFHVSAGVAVLLSAIAAHDRCTVGVLVGRLTAERAREIGCGFLAREVLDRDEGGP